MRAVEVVAPAEERGRLIEPGRLQRAHVLRHAIHFLVDIRCLQVPDTVPLKFVGIPPAIDEEIPPWLHADARVFGQRRLEAQQLARHALAPLGVAVAEQQEVQCQAREIAARQDSGRLEGRGKDIDLAPDRTSMMNAGIQGLGQADHAQGRLVPISIAVALNIGQHVAAFQHGRRVAKRECLNGDCGGR